MNACLPESASSAKDAQKAAAVRFFVLLKFRPEFICFEALFLQLLTLYTKLP